MNYFSTITGSSMITLFAYKLYNLEPKEKRFGSWWHELEHKYSNYYTGNIGHFTLRDRDGKTKMGFGFQCNQCGHLDPVKLEDHCPNKVLYYEAWITN